tara:strand:+ start:1346 stop:1552 length:207 start_codon:yes stop_codon:yes gene_type:complete
VRVFEDEVVERALWVILTAMCPVRFRINGLAAKVEKATAPVAQEILLIAVELLPIHYGQTKQYQTIVL